MVYWKTSRHALKFGPKTSINQRPKTSMNQIKGGGRVDWLVLEHLLSAMSMRKNHPHQRKLLLREKIDYPIHHTHQISTQNRCGRERA